MTRFTSIDLSNYPVSDVLELLSFESYLARDRADFKTRWNARRVTRPELPEFNTLLLETDPSSVVLEVGSYRETILRARINDQVRSLMLSGALGAALDHIGITYYRTTRRIITPADGTTPAVVEDDETFRQRLAIAPESWSTAGPVGAYLFWGLSADGDVLDIAAYSEDEGVAKAPHVRVPILSRTPAITAPAMATLVATVQAALRRDDIRPLADLVTVEAATNLAFDVSVHLTVRNGASQQLVTHAAKKRIEQYCSGRLRWIGDDIEGPVWLIGRQIRTETIAAAAHGSDSNVLEVDVITPAVDVNAPHASYDPANIPNYATDAFVPLPALHTAHLFTAPRLGTVTVTASIAAGGWS
jgi:phage-related baseplate assembly protein